MTKCPKCGRDNGWAYSEGYLCGNCKVKGRRNIYFVCGLLAILFVIIGAVFGLFQYGYELEKCSKLSSDESNYDFDHTIEMNAQYNSNCYFLRNHPLALLSKVAFGMFIGLSSTILIGLLWNFKYI